MQAWIIGFLVCQPLVQLELRVNWINWYGNIVILMR